MPNVPEVPLVLPPRLATADSVEFRDLAHRQFGVARRGQILASGVSPGQVDAALDGRRWREVAPSVIVLHNGPLTVEQQWSAATLAGGRTCALAARTGAEAAGLEGWPAPVLEVVVPRGVTYPRIAGMRVKVHESRRFRESDIQPATFPPRCRVERCLVDAAVWSRSPRAACGVLAAGVQQRLTMPSHLLNELEAAGAVRRRRLLRSALVDIAGGAQALSEIDFLRFCRRNGFPQPVLQRVRRDSAGRRRYLDATFRRRDGRLITVEIDGALHLVVATYWSDMLRDNDLHIDGELVLRFPSAAMHFDDPRMVGQLRRALGISGPGEVTAA